MVVQVVTLPMSLAGFSALEEAYPMSPSVTIPDQVVLNKEFHYKVSECTPGVEEVGSEYGC